MKSGTETGSLINAPKVDIYAAGQGRCTVDVDGRRSAVILNEGGRWWLRRAASTRMDDFRPVGPGVDVQAIIHDTAALRAAVLKLVGERAAASVGAPT